MERGNFIALCAGGACAGSLFAADGARPAPAATEPASPQAEQPDRAELEWRLDAARRRFARMIVILGEELGEAQRKRILRRLGEACAQDYAALFARFRGDIDGFLAEINRRWAEKAEYDRAGGAVRVVDKADRCTCPLVLAGATPAAFCECTIGWQQAAYSVVLGRPVTAELEESILRGGRRCRFTMRPG